MEVAYFGRRNIKESHQWKFKKNGLNNLKKKQKTHEYLNVVITVDMENLPLATRSVCVMSYNVHEELSHMMCTKNVKNLITLFSF